MNEAVERAHVDGVLTHASLMVAGPAAADAVARAKRLPALGVGLHLVVVEGPAVLGREWFPSDQLRLGLSYAFDAAARRQLDAEVAAQFQAFAATDLPLSHADAHKHMHLHPVVGRLMIDIGREFGLRAIRVPAEPPAIMAALGTPQGPGARALHSWTRLLRRQATNAGLFTNDAAFGLAWSGHMTRHRLLRLIPHLPPGVSELYFHPAASRDPTLDRLMPDYEHEAELAALLDPEIAAALAGTARTSYGALA